MFFLILCLSVLPSNVVLFWQRYSIGRKEPLRLLGLSLIEPLKALCISVTLNVYSLCFQHALTYYTLTTSSVSRPKGIISVTLADVLHWMAKPEISVCFNGMFITQKCCKKYTHSVVRARWNARPIISASCRDAVNVGH